jgi:acyl-coenzyme A thioesterase PaaI-like protein
LLYRGRRTATSQARLVDTAGKLLAHGSCTCLLFAL